MSKILDLVTPGSDFYLPAATTKKFTQPFIIIARPLDRGTLSRLLDCEDFDCIENIEPYVNTEVTYNAAFYRE